MQSNESILKVIKWLNNKNSVSVEELKENHKSASERFYWCNSNLDQASNAAHAALNALSSVCATTITEAYDFSEAASNMVGRFFDESGHYKEDYINEIERRNAQNLVNDTQAV